MQFCYNVDDDFPGASYDNVNEIVKVWDNLDKIVGDAIFYCGKSFFLSLIKNSN